MEVLIELLLPGYGPGHPVSAEYRARLLSVFRVRLLILVHELPEETRLAAGQTAEDLQSLGKLAELVPALSGGVPARGVVPRRLIVRSQLPLVIVTHASVLIEPWLFLNHELHRLFALVCEAVSGVSLMPVRVEHLFLRNPLIFALLVRLDGLQTLF